MLQALMGLYRAWKFKRAASQSSTGETCAACDSHDTTMLAQAAYRCNTCGYEGGDGYAAWQNSQRAKQLSSLPERERRTRAHALLKEARTLLLSGRGDLNSALSNGTLDLLGVGGTGNMGLDGEGGEKYNDVLQAMRMLCEAQQHTHDAFTLLYPNTTPNTPKPDLSEIPSYAETALDIHFDNAFSDLAFLARIHNITQDIDLLDRSIQQALETEFPNNTP